MSKILFLGDWAPGTSRVSWQTKNDLIFINLEGPVIGNEVSAKLDFDHFQSQKAGPLLSTPHLPELGQNVIFNLANNHFMDFDHIGAQETMKTLKSINGLTVGYGENENMSRKPLRIVSQGKRISIISACENQFGCSSTERAGVAGFGSWIFPKIQFEKSMSDFVVVSFHGGAENHPLPAPYFQDLYRSFIDLGADLVIGHHPHTPQGFEFYTHGFIAYGLGNFAVNPKQWNADPLNLISLGVRVDFAGPKPKILITYFQIQETLSGIKIVEIANEFKNDLDFYFDSLNKIVANRSDLELVWKNVAYMLWNESISEYLAAFSIQDSFKSRILKFFKFYLNRDAMKDSLRKLAKSRNLVTRHVVSCESHSQVINTVLNDNVGLSIEEIARYTSIIPRLIVKP